MKILNLYAGIGGNRKLWADCDVTAIENNPQIAEIYRDFFPDDTVIVGDAHQYLLEHYDEFDFIWASPPCPTHSILRRLGVNKGQNLAVYPDMTLYQEIVFLTYYFKGLWAVENVVPFYEYLIKPSVILNRHPFWANFLIAKKNFDSPMPIKGITGLTTKVRQELLGVDITDYKVSSPSRKDQVLRNFVFPPIGAYILDQARQKPTANTQSMQLSLMP